MAQIVEPGTRTSRNIDLNVVPFIDLMSCLTAFLLVTAVWVHHAELQIEPAGRGRDQPCREGDPECDKPRLSVLVEPERIWIGISRVEEYETIARTDAGHDWSKLEERLRHHKASALFAGETTIEVAALSTDASPVRYQTLIGAMDVAVKAGFVDVGVTEPTSLSARPTL
jgi:biopolymer transport protein TolR